MRMTFGKTFGFLGGFVLAAGMAGGAHASISSGVELVNDALDPPGTGGFGSGFTNYRLMTNNNWHESSSASDENVSAASREVLQDEANSTVPTTAAGTHWLGLNPDSSFTNPSAYYSLGTWNTGDSTTFDVGFDLGDRSNTTFGSLTVDLVYTNAGFLAADGTALTTAAGYTVADSTATFTDGDAGWSSVSGGRVQTGLTDTLDLTGVSDGQEVWIRLGATGNGTQSFIDNLSVVAQPIPEPASLALMGLGGLMMLGRSRRQA